MEAKQNLQTFLEKQHAGVEDDATNVQREDKPNRIEEGLQTGIPGILSPEELRQLMGMPTDDELRQLTFKPLPPGMKENRIDITKGSGVAVNIGGHGYELNQHAAPAGIDVTGVKDNGKEGNYFDAAFLKPARLQGGLQQEQEDNNDDV